jgi:6-phosphofructokinase 2
MILTLTLNPAADKTLLVTDLTLGALNRARASQIDPGGKGINVSRVVHRLGHPTIAFGFLAGNLGALVARALDDEGVAHRFVWVAGETRLDAIAVDEASGKTTRIYDRGPEIGDASLRALLDDVRRWLPSCRVLVAAGSLPPGVPHDVHAALLAEARRLGVQTILDADGETLRRGLAGRPSLIKPNVEEAEALLRRRLPDLPAMAAAARELLSLGVGAAIVSMGSRGSICATPDGVLHAVSPPVERRSTVGSGDSLVAGMAIALAIGAPIADGLRLGTAAGAATAMTPGTQLGAREDVEQLLPRVDIRPIEA